MFQAVINITIYIKNNNIFKQLQLKRSNIKDKFRQLFNFFINIKFQ